MLLVTLQKRLRPLCRWRSLFCAGGG